MTKFLKSIATAVALMSAAAHSAEFAPEGDFSATFHLTDQLSKPLPTANGEAAYAVEESAVYRNDAGHGFLHDATGRCVGVGASNASTLTSGGYCTFVDAEGDMIFSIFHLARVDAELKGVLGFTGGTGKYTGLAGNGRYTLTGLRSFDKETTSIWEGHIAGHYRLGPGAPKSDHPDLKSVH